MQFLHTVHYVTFNNRDKETASRYDYAYQKTI